MTAHGGGYDPILFDLDGTVIDSVALIRESHRHAVREVLGATFPDERLVANVGRPLIDQMRAFSVDQADELLRVYREWNHAHTAGLLRAYDGIDRLLAELRAGGRTLGIITSKSHPTVDLAFDVLPIRHHFSVVIAAEDTKLHKPDPAPIHLALERLGADSATACYVGDAPFDIRAAVAAGITPIGVTWGFFNEDALRDAGAGIVVSSTDALASTLLGR
jgi:pyrophosphatase PpaX